MLIYVNCGIILTQSIHGKVKFIGFLGSAYLLPWTEVQMLGLCFLVYFTWQSCFIQILLFFYLFVFYLLNNSVIELFVGLGQRGNTSLLIEFV